MEEKVKSGTAWGFSRCFGTGMEREKDGGRLLKWEPG